MQDILLEKFFEKQRWENALSHGVAKDMNTALLTNLTSPYARIKLYRDIKSDEYKIQPPHEARIPKDDGTFRTVYVNEGLDRIVLSIINDMFFEFCHDMIHPACKSYQKGIGCGKIVQSLSQKINDIKSDEIGYKIDLSKYFDSVPIEYIDKAFDDIETRTGKSLLINIVKDYYHMNTVLDMDKNPVEKYSSLRQGCAVAAFLADAVLYDIDEYLCDNYDITYVRYSDDILILGKDSDAAFEQISKMLKERGLALNPKKVEKLSKHRWFKFLGFNIKGRLISLSKARVKNFQNEIDERTIKKSPLSVEQAVKAVHSYLYKGNDEYSWGLTVLPVINVQEDIKQLNNYVMDAIRASITNKTRIGGLGIDFSGISPIQRGTGRNVSANKQKIPHIDNYLSLKTMQNALLLNKSVYNALLNT